MVSIPKQAVGFVDEQHRTVLHSGRVYGGSTVVLDPNFQLSEHQAMEEASQRIAATLVSEIAEGW